MDEQYFTPKPGSTHEIREIEAEIDGMIFRFRTDAGVFSRKQIDPGTLLLAENMRVERDDLILDLGCGYGVLGIVAARRARDGRAVMVDINERAVSLARTNITLNGVENARALVSDGFSELEGRLFDLIVTNPPLRSGKGNVERLIRESKQHLKDRGHFYFVARTRQGARSYRGFMEDLFREVDLLDRGSGYRVYRARDR